MNTIEISRVTINDLAQLQSIARQTFFESFAADNTEENMKKYLEEEFSETKLSVELSEPNSEYYFASTGGNIMGYLKINFGQSQTELQDDNSVEIERIYVIREFQGKKVGQQLYEKAIQIARQKNAKYVWLGVWDKNQRAINFYTKNGFAAFDSHIFILGDEVQTDIMMKLQLTGLQ